MKWSGYDEIEEHIIEMWNLNSVLVSDLLIGTVNI